MEELKVGDIVHLKSGSPRMTIIAISETGWADVVYLPFGLTKMEFAKLPLAALEVKNK